MTLTVYSKTVCPYCVQAKNYLKQNKIDFEEINIEKDDEARDFIMSQGHRTVPQIYLNGELFVSGGWEGLSKMGLAAIRQRLNPTDLGTL